MRVYLKFVLRNRIYAALGKNPESDSRSYNQTFIIYNKISFFFDNGLFSIKTFTEEDVEFLVKLFSSLLKQRAQD